MENRLESNWKRKKKETKWKLPFGCSGFAYLADSGVATG